VSYGENKILNAKKKRKNSSLCTGNHTIRIGNPRQQATSESYSEFKQRGTSVSGVINRAIDFLFENAFIQNVNNNFKAKREHILTHTEQKGEGTPLMDIIIPKTRNFHQKLPNPYSEDAFD